MVSTYVDPRASARRVRLEAARFPDNPDIQLRLAMGAFNAITAYGSTQRTGRLLTLLKTNSATSWTLASFSKIQS